MDAKERIKELENTMEKHFDLNCVRGQVKELQNTMEKYFDLGEHVDVPSSYWDEDMVMLSDEPDLPLALRLYVSWNPYQERSHDNFVWFCPWHVFRRASEHSYVLAQDISTKQWIEWSKRDGWQIRTWTTGLASLLNGAPFI
jgi:hypothetical protein